MASGQSPSSNPTIVGNCISCEGLVRVSAKTKANASVRCPHCQETFPLTALLESVAPEVEILQGGASTTTSASPPVATPASTTPAPAPPARPQKAEFYIDQTAETAKDAAGKFVVPSQLAKGARRRKSSRRGRSSRSSSSRSDSGSSRDGRSEDFDHRNFSRTSNKDQNGEAIPSDASRNGSSRDSQQREQSERAEGANPHHAIHSHRSTRHRDQRAIEESSEPNAAVAILKIFAGGILAMPISYLIVMWVFSRDPFYIGERLGEKLPFVVPASMRAAAEEDDTDSASPNSGIADFDDQNPDSPSRVIESGFGDSSIGSEALKGLDP